MSVFILGVKDRMSQLFDENGRVHPVTVLRVEQNRVTDIKTQERDGYTGVQVGSGTRKASRVSKSERGHLRAAYTSGDDEGYARVVREYRISDKESNQWTIGAHIDIDAFEVGDKVSLSSTSKGKGFQGTVKRHGFSGGPRSHGQKHGERSPGSIGATGPARVFPGTRMAGRMGGKRVTVTSARVMHVDPDRQELYIRGAVPGRKGSTVEVRKK